MNEALFKCGIMVFLIIVGYLLKRIGVFQQQDSKLLSKIMMYVTLPALVINAFRNFELDISLVVMIFLGVAANVILAIVGYYAALKETPTDRAMYMLSLSGFNIGSFCIPFISNTFPAHVVNVVMFDIGNAIMNCGSIYSVAMAQASGEKFSLKAIVKKLLACFPFDMYIVIFILSLLHIRFPAPVYEVATVVANANTVIVMLMLGILFEVRLTATAKRQVFTIVAVRVICELLFAAFALFVLPFPIEQRKVAAMLLCAPISSMTAVFCSTFDCDPDVYGTSTSITIPISIVLMMSIAVF